MYTLHAYMDTRATHQRLQAESPTIPSDPELTNKLAVYFANKRVAASGIVGSTLYEIAHDGLAVDDGKRREVAIASSRMSLAQDLADMVVDIDMAGAPETERFDYIQAGLKVMLTGQIEADKTVPVRQRAAYHTAKLLHDTMFSHDKTGSSEEVLNELVVVAKEQLVATDPTDQLELAKSLGASCCEAIALFSEIVDGAKYPLVREVARHMGAYSEILDHLYEVDEDIAEGSLTYATVRLMQEGDTQQTRDDIKVRMLQEAQEVRGAILPSLTPYQRRRYNGMLNLVAYKYRIANWRRMRAAHQHVGNLQLARA